MEFKEILQDPTKVFDSPSDVLAAKELNREEKIEVLQRWEDDCKLLQVAEGEGMEARSNTAAETLQKVLSALKSLGSESGAE